MLDAAIVFAPADIVTDTAIKAVKKGGMIVIATNRGKTIICGI